MNLKENENQVEFLLTKAEIKYSFTKEQLRALGEMSMFGISSAIAGQKLREALIASNLFK